MQIICDCTPHDFYCGKKKKIASKIPERDRNAYQISKRDTQKEMDQRATFIFQFYFF